MFTANVSQLWFESVVLFCKGSPPQVPARDTLHFSNKFLWEDSQQSCDFEHIVKVWTVGLVWSGSQCEVSWKTLVIPEPLLRKPNNADSCKEPSECHGHIFWKHIQLKITTAVYGSFTLSILFHPNPCSDPTKIMTLFCHLGIFQI